LRQQTVDGGGRTGLLAEQALRLIDVATRLGHRRQDGADEDTGAKRAIQPLADQHGTHL